MTKTIRKASILAFAAICSSAMLTACAGTGPSDKSGEIDPTVGKVGLAIQLAPGVTVDSVHYVVTGNGQNLAGDIPVAAAGSTISVEVGLPAGTGYHIQMTATSNEVPHTTCIGGADFAVTAGTSTSAAVHVKLQCDGVHVLGAARADGTLNICPTVNTYTVSPLQVSVGTGAGHDITVTSTASDLDPGTTLIYAWTASGGSFVDPTAANTTYHCSAPGTQTLTITVSDGVAASNPCSDSTSVTVNCVALSCGNGTLDTGETCDHGANNGLPADTCSAVCTNKCGNGTVDTAAGETCEPAGTISCDASCHSIVGCGNGIVETGEQCDHGLGVGNATGSATCDATCHNRCGNGVVDTGEQCDQSATPNGAPAGSSCVNCIVQNLCGNGVINTGEQCDPPRAAVCTAVTCQTATCRTCEQTAQCSPAETAGQRITECESAAGNVGAGPLAGQSKASVCKQVLDCVHTNHCANNGLNPEWCWCGIGTDLNECLAGTPGPDGTCSGGGTNTQGNPCVPGVAGLCKDIISGGAESTDIGTISSRFVNKSFATGAAMRLVQCDAVRCGDATGATDPFGCF